MAERLKALKLWQKVIGGGIVVVLLILLIIQLIPLDRTNPKVVTQMNWDSPKTEELARAACFDCHSNETTWPWYSKVAPIKLLVWNDVRGGRERLNFSEWNSGGRETDEIAEVINEGEMPPWFYVIMHPKAKLSDSEKQALADGLVKTIAQTP